MSGECYTNKDQQMDGNPSKESIANKGMKGDAASDKNNLNINQLLAYEDMVSSAENKCSFLKGQLEKIKQLYANQAEIVKQAMDMDKNHPPYSIASKSTTGKIVTESSGPPSSVPKAAKNIKMVRQNSRCISTDTTGAALGTINNILAGITKSIQMPEFFEQIKEIQTKTSRDPSVKSHEQKSLHGVEEVKINSRNKICRFKPRRSTSRIATRTSSTVIKKAKKSSIKIPEKRTRTSEGQLKRSTIPLMDKRSKKIIKRPRVAPKVSYNRRGPASANQDLVEIYHNTAVKESKSSESDVPKKRLLQEEGKETTAVDLIPPLNIDDIDDKPYQHRSMMSALSRNYEMPTISSRMKQVAKYYMNSFNIRSIPFCPATSTGPSHNIGINIQQVMSMVKTKQPVQQLSPTLAYNIGLAAGKWNDTNPLSFLVSSMTSRLYPHCPLSKSTINYQHLQEVAKTVPQDVIQEEEENDEVNSPETQSMIITGPSGDIKVHTKKKVVWTANSDDKKCICAPPKGVEFQQIINKFNGSVSKAKMNKSSTPNVRTVPKVCTSEVIHKDPVIKPPDECLPLQNKEKKLKEVLGKLHDEFEQMTKTYDELVQKSEGGNASEEITKKLEILDKELNSKEEEIMMVMSLYKEVLALKQQVKTLRERTSKENVTIRSQPTTKSNNGYNNNAAAGLLNKLLKQIHHFQSHYKKN